MRKRATVRAVWDSDLETLLNSLGILDRLLAGDFRCAICDQPVELENLGALVSSEGALRVTCDSTACIRAATAPEVVPSDG